MPNYSKPDMYVHTIFTIEGVFPLNQQNNTSCCIFNGTNQLDYTFCLSMSRSEKGALHDNGNYLYPKHSANGILH